MNIVTEGPKCYQGTDVVYYPDTVDRLYVYFPQMNKIEIEPVKIQNEIEPVKELKSMWSKLEMMAIEDKLRRIYRGRGKNDPLRYTPHKNRRHYDAHCKRRKSNMKGILCARYPTLYVIINISL